MYEQMGSSELGSRIVLLFTESLIWDISPCRICVLQDCLSLLSCDPAVWLPQQPTVVAWCCVPCRLVHFVLYVISLGILGSSFPMGLSPSQIPSLLGTAQPSWREMPAANYTQVDRAHKKVCETFVFVFLWLLVFVIVFIRDPKKIGTF